MFGSGRTIGGVGVAFAVALASSGCVKGVGDPCVRNAECEPGLSCYLGKCVTCGDGTACLAFDLVTTSCEGAFEPLQGADSLEFTLKVEGEPDKVETANLSDGSLENLPNIPPGKDARLIVAAKQGANVVARGSSATFQVQLDDIGPAATVYLRKVNEFSPTNTAAGTSTTACAALTEARAGHTMTLLADGRVLIAGGYRVEDNQKVPLKSVELYDPRTGTFANGASTQLQQARWGHTATALPDGRVLVVGGTGRINGLDQHLATAELFDPAKWGQANAFASVKLEGRRGRMNHAATLLPEEGVVVISGGYASVSDSAPQDVVEVFDPKRSATATYVPRDATDADVTLSANRAHHRMVPIGNGQLAVIGGKGDASAIADTDVIQVLNDQWSVRAAVSQFKLRKAREFPIAMPFGAGADTGVLVLGKPSDGSAAPADVWEWVKVGETAAPDRDVATPPIYRKDACAAIFDSGTVQGAVVVGGRDLGANSVLLSSADVVTLTTGETRKFVSSRAGQIQNARAMAACVALADGSVLVTGGIAKVSNADEAQTRAEIYQP